MSSTAHFPDADSFHRQSDEFMAWLVQNPGVRVNSKIRIADLRSRDAGRGVGMFLVSFPLSLLQSPQGAIFLSGFFPCSFFCFC